MTLPNEDVMIDLETMGTASDAPIMSIGAVFFDRFTGALGKEFHTRVTLQSNMHYNRIPSSGTIEWWLRQSKQAQTELLDGRKETLSNALYSLTSFLHVNQPDKKQVKPWANGLNFDITILEHAYSSMEGKAMLNWHYQSLRDVRTAVQLGWDIGIDAHQFQFEGTAHNALSDAKHQAKIVASIWGMATSGFRS